MDIVWRDGFEITVKSDGDTVVISANREWLRSLADHFAALAEGEPGDHIHYDEHNSLEEGSAEFVVVKQ